MTKIQEIFKRNMLRNNSCGLINFKISCSCDKDDLFQYDKCPLKDCIPIKVKTNELSNKN